MNDIIRIVIVDDHTMFREAVAGLLEMEKDIVVIAQGSSASEAIHLTHELEPDILLLDINMPGDGLKSAQIVAADNPNTKVIMLTGIEDDENVKVALEAGACAYVLKGVSGRELLRVIRGIHSGDCYATPFQPLRRGK